MANTNIDLTYPEFWAQSFEELMTGQYELQNYVSRKFESAIGQMGDTVNVPIVPSASASTYDVDGEISFSSITQVTKQVVLDQSKNASFILNSKEYSLSAYNLMENYGIPHAQAILEAANDYIYGLMLTGTNFSTAPVATSSINEDTVIDLKDALDTLKVSRIGRYIALDPASMNRLLKADAFQYANYSGDGGRAMATGELVKKFNFSFIEADSIAKYTPADVAGVTGGIIAAAATTMTVSGFNDDANPIRVGDIFHVGSSTDYYTVTATTKTTGDTTGITFSPGLTGEIASGAAINIDASKSIVAYHPSAIAFAARPYAAIPDGMGARSVTTNYKGLPVRVSTWQKDLKLAVQFDVLYGGVLVHNNRIYRKILT